LPKAKPAKKNEFVAVRAIHELPLQNWIENNKNLLVSARDEAHRFAIAYQKKLRRNI